MVVALHDTGLAEKVDKLNMARFDRGNLIGGRVSSERPSVIGNPSIKNGFYGAPTAACVFCQKVFAFSIPDAFVIAQAMALEANSPGIFSCIVSRGVVVFRQLRGQKLRQFQKHFQTQGVFHAFRNGHEGPRVSFKFPFLHRSIRWTDKTPKGEFPNERRQDLRRVPR